VAAWWFHSRRTSRQPYPRPTRTGFLACRLFKVPNRTMLRPRRGAPRCAGHPKNGAMLAVASGGAPSRTHTGSSRVDTGLAARLHGLAAERSVEFSVRAALEEPELYPRCRQLGLVDGVDHVASSYIAVLHLDTHGLDGGNLAAGEIATARHSGGGRVYRLGSRTTLGY